MQADENLRKIKEESEKEEKQKSKQSASWIWEKNEMERQLKVSAVARVTSSITAKLFLALCA